MKAAVFHGGSDLRTHRHGAANIAGPVVVGHENVGLVRRMIETEDAAEIAGILSREVKS